MLDHVIGGAAQHLDEHVVTPGRAGHDHGGEEGGQEQQVGALAVVPAQVGPVVTGDTIGLQGVEVEVQQGWLVGPADLARQGAGQEVGQVRGACAVGEGLPVQDGHGIAPRRRGEHHVVGPEVVVRQAAGTVMPLAQPGIAGGDPVPDLDPLRLQAISVAVLEAHPEHGHGAVVHRACLSGFRTRHPGQVIQAVVPPVRGVQAGRLHRDQAGLVKGDSAQLVALVGRRQVLHHQDKVVGRLVHVGEPAAGRMDQGLGCQVLVEAHLSQVVAQGHAGGAALRPCGGELADQGVRGAVATAGVVEGEADTVADLARAHRTGGEAAHLGVHPAGGEDGGQPGGVDIAGFADVGSGHGRGCAQTALMAVRSPPSPPRSKPRSSPILRCLPYARPGPRLLHDRHMKARRGRAQGFPDGARQGLPGGSGLSGQGQGDVVEGQDIALGTQPRDHPGDPGAHDGVAAPVCFHRALVDVGDVHLHHRAFAHLQGVQHRGREVAEAGGIDHQACVLSGRLDPVDHLVLAVGLPEIEVKTMPAGGGGAQGLHVGQGARAIEMRLPLAQQVQVRTVQHMDPAAHGALPRQTPPDGGGEMALAPCGADVNRGR